MKKHLFSSLLFGLFYEIKSFFDVAGNVHMWGDH